MLVCFAVIACCSPQTNEAQDETERELVKIVTPPKSKPETVKKIEPLEFEEVEYISSGLIIEASTILDLDKRPTNKKFFATGSLVEIIARSATKFNRINTTDICDSYPFIKIKQDTIVKWVLGDGVYEFREPNIGRVFTFEKNYYKVIRTRNFGIGAFDNEGLTGCDEFFPLALRVNSNQGYKLIDISNSEKPRYNDFEYANILSDVHQLVDIEIDSVGVIMYFDAEYMEDAETYELRLSNFSQESVIGTMNNRKEREFKY